MSESGVSMTMKCVSSVSQTGNNSLIRQLLLIFADRTWRGRKKWRTSPRTITISAWRGWAHGSKETLIKLWCIFLFPTVWYICNPRSLFYFFPPTNKKVCSCAPRASWSHLLCSSDEVKNSNKSDAAIMERRPRQRGNEWNEESGLGEQNSVGVAGWRWGFYSIPTLFYRSSRLYVLYLFLFTSLWSSWRSNPGAANEHLMMW